MVNPKVRYCERSLGVGSGVVEMLRQPDPNFCRICSLCTDAGNSATNTRQPFWFLPDFCRRSQRREEFWAQQRLESVMHQNAQTSNPDWFYVR